VYLSISHDLLDERAANGCQLCGVLANMEIVDGLEVGILCFKPSGDLSNLAISKR
jgi:hypothetical protein